MSVETRAFPGFEPADCGDDEKKQKSVDKALMLMDAFQGSVRPMGVSAIARRSGLPKTTAHRLLAHLEGAGFVERDGTSYRVGRKVFTLGTLAKPQALEDLRYNSMPYLSELFVTTGFSVCLGVLTGADVRIEAKIQGHKGFHARTRSGDTMAASCSSLGKAILAFSPAKVINEAVGTRLPRLTRNSIANNGRFAAELHSIRRTGYAIDREEITLGVASVAAPVLVGGRAVAAVSITGPTHRFNVSAHASAVQRAAAAIASVMQSPQAVA